MDVGCNKVSVKQNSSGFWYCADLTINCVSIMDGIALIDKAIGEIIKVLEEKNKE